jgi:hypothetical protein
MMQRKLDEIQQEIDEIMKEWSFQKAKVGKLLSGHFMHLGFQ